MTSRISLGKLIKEELKHHIISIFAVVLVFLGEILFFYFAIQKLIQEGRTMQYYREVLASEGEPTITAMIPTMMLAVLLAIEYFNYLHSQQKVDFYMSLPMRRKNQFWMGIIVCGIIYLVPCVCATGCECIVMYATGYGTSLCLENMIWRFLCKMIAFAACFLTMTLAMIMTGHLVVAMLGFGAFCSYVPLILRWIVPVYESVFFDTYTASYDSSGVWNYFSPITLIYGLTRDYLNWTIARHWQYFIASIVFVVIIGCITRIAYIKRPAEAAGRAMAFSKMNSLIRFLIVIPLALYFGWVISEVAPNATIGWLFGGMIIGAVILHGIMESIFQFDMRGMYTKKKQLGISIFICGVFILFFQMDIFKYDAFVPDAEKIESVKVIPTYKNTNLTDGIYVDQFGGMSGEVVNDVVKLAEILVTQNDQIKEELNLGDSNINGEIGAVTITYQMKNGGTKARTYYMNLGDETVCERVNKVCETAEFKKDFCILYNVQSEDVKRLVYDDVLTTQTLNFSEEEQREFISIYLDEFAKMSLTDMENIDKVANLRVEYKESLYLEYFREETYDIYKSFTKTIAFLEKHGVEVGKTFKNCELVSLEAYDLYISELEGTLPGYEITDREVLESIKNELVMAGLYEEGYVHGKRYSRSGATEVLINGKRNVYDVYISEKLEKILETARE